MDDKLAGFFAEIAETEAQLVASPVPASDGEADGFLSPPPAAAEEAVAAPRVPVAPEDLRSQIEHLRQQRREGRDGEAVPSSSSSLPVSGPPTVAPPPAHLQHPSAGRPPYPSGTNVGMAYGVRPPIMGGLPAPPPGLTTYSAPPVVASHAPPTVLPPMSTGTTVTIGGMSYHNQIITTSASAPVPRKQRHGPQTEETFYRMGAGKVWVDETLQDWPEDDFRIFVGNLGNDVNADALGKAFSRYPSFQKAKVIRDPRSNKTKGFGFVSFGKSQDMIRALKEMNNKYVGNRPVQLKAGKWKERACEPTVAAEILKDQKATGWEQRKKRRYHVTLDLKADVKNKIAAKSEP